MVEDVGRIFAAVPLSPDARLAVAARIEGLDIPGKLVPPEAWHLTVRFLGTIDRTVLERFLQGLDQADLPKAFRVLLSDLGGFPNIRRASVIWAGVKGGVTELGTLNEVAEDAAQRAGLPAEERPYRPHLTLSRVRPPQDVTHLSEVRLAVTYSADRLVVYRTHMGRGGARYEVLENFGLGA